VDLLGLSLIGKQTHWRHPELGVDEKPDGEGPVSLYGGVGVRG
jgi:hypothetical protein